MWRIYSGDRTGVRLRTTRAKLEVALTTYKERSSIDFFIGDVEYLSAREVTSRISDIAKDLKREYKSRRAADALLVKRDAFDHEAEVRVILHDQELIGQPKPKPFFRVPISADTLIDNISFDPRADDAFVKMFTYYLKNSLKFEGTIKKSKLYRVREPVVVD